MSQTERRAETGPSGLFCESCVSERAGSNVVILRKKIAGLSSSTLERFVLRARRFVRLRDPVNVLVTNSAELRSLNQRFRRADKVTDVLSFPALPSRSRQAKRIAGDVAVSADIARENASRFGHSVADEVKILVLHGILHLAGFDHERDNGKMARKESQLRLRLKLEGGLIARTQPLYPPPSRKRRTA
jgi:probable rRNA maturation factor